MTDLISLAQFHVLVKHGKKPEGPVFCVSLEPTETVADKPRTLRFCFSDGSVDRMGDTIDPNGWDLTAFERNPVALWAHDSSAPPIGVASNVGKVGERLMGDIEFAPAATYAFAETIFRLVEGKYIRAVSVGFIPHEYSFVENDPDRGFGIDFKRQELLEISLCPIPANPNALGEARAKGIDTRPLVEWAERALDGGGKIVIPKAELERLRKAAKEPKAMAKKPVIREPAEGDPPKGDCGREKDDPCGMTDPKECITHSGAKTADDDGDEKAIRRLLRRLGVRMRAEGEPDGDEEPMPKEDCVRMAHKCMRTSKAFMAEGMLHHSKALDLLGDAVDAIDGDPETDPPADPDPDANDKAAQLRRAAALKRKHRPAAAGA